MKLKAEGKAASTNHIPSKRILGKSGSNSGKSVLDLSGPVAQPPKQPCPQCSSKGPFYKDGMRYTSQGEIQRYLCRSCGFRFSERLLEPNQEVKVSRKIRTFKPSPDLAEPRVCEGDSAGKEIFDNGSFTFGKDIRAHSITNLGKGLYALSSYSSNAECALKKAKNLDATLQQQVAGESQDVKGKVLQFMVKLKNDGNQETTIQGYAKVLRQLIRKGASLNDGENVKEVLANQKWAESTKQYASIVYDKFAEYSGIQWERPKYRPDRKLPFIPLESEIDSLIAHCGKKLATLLRLLKESGLRVGEAIRLEWKDLDIKNSTITLNKPEKHGTCRMFKVSTELLAMLNSLPKNSNRIFGPRVLSSYEGDFSLQRKRAVNKLQNPRLLQIHFHTFRHWKATIEYAKTKDLLHVMKLLGHRSVQNTLIYTQLISFESNEYHSATAKTIREAAQLVEAGFEFVCAVDNIQLFRKRK